MEAKPRSFAEQPPRALDGVRVLDLSQYIAGPFCTKLLADYGADVVKIERPGRGDVARLTGPFPTGIADPESSGLFLYLNSSKRSVALDLGDEMARRALHTLVRGADVMVESFRPGTLERWGLGPDVLCALNPRLVLLRLSNFGQTGPYRGWKASELVLYAIGGEMFGNGVAGREPIKLAASASQIEAGTAAASAVLAALLHAEATGKGQVIDCALTETQLAGIDRRSASLIGFQYSGKITERTAGAGAIPAIWPCSDGYVDMVTAVGDGFQRAVRMLGNPPNLLDERFQDPMALLDPELRDEFVGTVLAWSVELSKREAWRQAQAAKVLSGPLNTMADVFADPELHERGVFATVSHPAVGPVTQPARPFIMQRTPARPPDPAPLLGQHTDEVLAQPWQPRAQPAEAPPRVAAKRPAAAPGLPLAGVRVIDLTVVWAGPFAAHILADLGAEVVRVESMNVFQTLTRGVQARPSQTLLDALPPWMGGYPGGVPGERPWNRYPTFNCHARNKLSVTLDLRSTAGRRNFAQLVASADVVLDNNVAETMRKIGITYESLRAMRDDIIYLRQPALADEGEYATYRALGVHLEGFIGHTLLRRYPDLDASMTSSVFVADYMAGAMGAFAVLTALRHRRRTGDGQLIELGQGENALPILAEAVMDYALSGTIQDSLGNRHPTAVQGVYRCADEDGPHGNDRWLALTVGTDGEWFALAEVVGNIDPGWRGWASQPELATTLGRRDQHDAIDARLATWLRQQPARVTMERLQAAGIAAGVVMNAADCYDDPQLAARAFFVETSQDDCGSFSLPGFMWQLSATPLQVRRGPVQLGQDNGYVYHELIGVDAAAYQERVSAGEAGDAYAPHVA